MDNKTKEVIIKSLDTLQSEVNKRNVLYELGVDLSNYENYFGNVCIDLLVHLLDGCRDEIEWWLYDGSKKAYYRKDEAGNEIEYPVENAKDFLDFLLTYELN